MLAGIWERSEVWGADPRCQESGWVVGDAHSSGPGTGTNQPGPPRLLSNSWLDRRWLLTHLTGGGLLTFSTVSSEDRLSKGKVKPAACTFSPLNSKGRPPSPSSTPVCTGGLGSSAPRVVGRNTNTSAHGFFSCLFGCDCPHMT